jgi:type IV secretory pathway VirB2 component (pilin)
MKATEFEILNFRGVKQKRLVMAILIAFSLLAVWSNVAAATGAGTSIGALPWESTLSGIAHSLTGPVALALSLVMVVVGIGVLMFGGDMAGWARWVAFAALAAGTLGGASNLINLLGVTGALI